ncbi:MAG: helix-turn-helix domain-containing protein [Syntrophorhabdus sp.]
MTPKTEITRLLTYEEVAEILQLHPQTLRQWVSMGKFPHLKIGSTVRFTAAMVDQFIKTSSREEHQASSSTNVKSELGAGELGGELNG